MGSRVRVFALVFVFALVVSACNWTMRGYDAAHTGFNPFERTITTTNVANLREVWSATTGDQIWSSPAVFDGVVYIGSLDNRLYAYDASGATNCAGTPRVCTPLWRSTNLGGDVMSSPAVTPTHVLVTSVGNNLVALDRSGTTNCTGTPKTCSPQWSFHVPTDAYSSPTVANGIVYINDGSYDDFVFAVDERNGSEVWSAGKETAGASPLSGSPAVANGVVYTQFPDAFFDPGPGLYVYDPAAQAHCSASADCGTPLWIAPVPGIGGGSPTVKNGVVYATGDGLYAFDATGNAGCSGTPKICYPRWSVANARGEPAVANGIVYAHSDSGNLKAFNAQTGAALWSTASLGVIALSDPVVANGIVYIGSSTGVHAFNAQSGAALWSSPPGNYAESTPAVVNGRVFIGGLDHKVHAFALS